MGLLGNLLSSSVDGVVIELDKEKTPYLIGEKVKINLVLFDPSMSMCRLLEPFISQLRKMTSR